jgi:hypothetical protein
MDEIDFCYYLEFPNLLERKEFLHYYLLSVSNKELNFSNLDINNMIDFEHIARQMDNWNFGDIKAFINYSVWIWKMETHLKEQINKKYDTTYLINLIDPFLKTNSANNPVFNLRQSGKSAEIQTPNNQESQNLIDLGSSKYQRDLEMGLYQDIVTEQYDELLLTLDKLHKGLILDQKDRLLLADYPFVLRDSPEKAMQKMVKAKTRIDRISRLNPKK